MEEATETDSQRNARLSRETGGTIVTASATMVGRGGMEKDARSKYLEGCMVEATEEAVALGIQDEDEIKRRKALALEKAILDWDTMATDLGEPGA